MADLPSLPAFPKSLLQDSPELARLAQLLTPYFQQINGALERITLKENLGAFVSGATTLTAGTDGSLSVDLPVSFTPQLVFFKAEEIDSQKKPTGAVLNGMAFWSTAGKEAGQGIRATRAPGLTSGTAYAVTFIALPG